MEERRVGEEARKSHQLRLENGFIDAYLSGKNILDIGYRGYIEDVVPIVPQATGIELDYPGYDGRTLPFADGSQDAVFASHCLEHIADFTQSLRDWHRVLAIGGFMVIMVPHQFLYEKRAILPSRFNEDHKRFYTPASLMADIEGALPPNSYRLRHLADNDRGFDYTIPPERHSGGCYEIELVIEKIAQPEWDIVTRETRPQNAAFDALATASATDIVRERGPAAQQIKILPASPWDLAVYDFGNHQPGHRRILAMQLGHFGDFIIGLPALRQLRAAFPQAHLTLVVGTWNRTAAETCGLVDAVLIHDHFPEVARAWNGEPVQSAEEFARTAQGHFHLAIDLRVDEDTRHLLQHVQADIRGGIGAPARYPYLDIVLPFDQTARSTDSVSRSLNVLLGPERFHSRLPVQSSFRHETDFKVTDNFVIFGPYLRLPAGRFRATFGLQLSALRFRRKRLRIKLDVVQGVSAVLAEQELGADDIADKISDDIYLDFTNTDEETTCEFRVYIGGRAPLAKLAFTGVKIQQLAGPAAPRFRRADLHIGEQLSLLVNLVADRTLALYPHPPEPVPPVGWASAHQSPHAFHIVIAPVSNSDLRDWPVEHYITLVRLLVEQLDCSIVLIGSRAQTGTLAHIVQASGVGHRVQNLAGRTAWADIPETLRGADLVICNNSGIAHLAASLGTRTLAIYSASHQPQEWGPRGIKSRALMSVIPCSPCGFDRLADCTNNHACMQGLLPETVFTQAAEWLRTA